jgi:hypothetical protein
MLGARKDDLMATMPLRIRVSGRQRVDDLLAYLRGLGADACLEGETITVRRRHAVVAGEPSYQDRVELEFVVRTWANMQGPSPHFEIEDTA